MNTAVEMLRVKEVARRVGVSKQTIWRWSQAGKFPTPRRLGEASVGWLSTEVTQWIAERPPVALVAA